VEHERALGGWQAELETVPALAQALGTSLDFMDTIATSLVVDAARMQQNLAAHAPEGPALDSSTALDELLAELAPYF
jgi:adenylosuccinate lyase